MIISSHATATSEAHVKIASPLCFGPSHLVFPCSPLLGPVRSIILAALKIGALGTSSFGNCGAGVGLGTGLPK